MVEKATKEKDMQKSISFLSALLRACSKRTKGFETMSMEYQVQENCLTIFLPKEVDHHNAEEVKKSADAIIGKRAYQICHF